MSTLRWASACVVILSACGGGGGEASIDAADPAADAALDAALEPPLGTATAMGPCTATLPTLLANARCEEVRITCPGMADATARLMIGDATAGPSRGTILFGSGSSGATLMEQASVRMGPGGEMTSFFVDELEDLRAGGYRVIERAWQGSTGSPAGDTCSGSAGSFDVTVDRGWIRGTEGPDDAACRYATLMTYLHDRYDADGAYCAVGFSGGSMELGMMLSRWGRGPLLDYALFVSGPAATFDSACLGDASLDAACASLTAGQAWSCSPEPAPACTLAEDIRCLLDRAYAGDSVCLGGGAADSAALLRDSVLAPGAPTTYPTTDLGVIVGLADCGSGAAITGADYAARVTGASGPPTLDFVAGAGHTVHRDAAGAAKIAERLRAGCVP